MPSQLSMDVHPSVMLGLETPFAASHLPLVCILSNRQKPDLEIAVPRHPKAWPFEDRLLSVFWPTLRPDISRFHRGRGGDIATVLPEHVLPRLDERLAHRVNTLLFHLWKHPRSKWRAIGREFFSRWRSEAVRPISKSKGIGQDTAEIAVSRGGDEVVVEARGIAQARVSPERSESIISVVEAVIDHQGPFLTHGIGALRPLTMTQIAEATGLHESTVSRVVGTVLIRTSLGTFRLRDLFSGAVASEGGGTVSNLKAKTILQEIIANEDIASPHTDLELADAMKRRGIVLARRTVAKYRGVLGIPSARERRRTNG